MVRRTHLLGEPIRNVENVQKSLGEMNTNPDSP